MDSNIQTGELVLPCKELTKTLDFFCEKLGFKLEMIFPADNPSVSVIFGYGLRLRLDTTLSTSKSESPQPTKLILRCANPEQVNEGNLLFLAPNGTEIELLPAALSKDIPPPLLKSSLVHVSFDGGDGGDGGGGGDGDGDVWGVGRAGMKYRDLIPGRLGGRFIASHIKIEKGGEVPDYNHYHNIRFQLIFCYKGWVRLVYEDQGDPFILEAGDCVLQPPLIRHRVLESSPGLEVVEVGCPAEHETFRDHSISLPTGKFDPDRVFNGQKFVRHIAKEGKWQPWRIGGFECRDTGITLATNSLVGAFVVHPNVERQGDVPQKMIITLKHHEEFLFFFILTGQMVLHLIDEGEGENKEKRLIIKTGDSVVIPEGLYHSLGVCSHDLSFLEIRLSSDFKTTEFSREK